MNSTRIKRIFIILIILAGSLVLLYPFISSWYNALLFTSVADTYEKKAGYLSDASIAAEWKKARDYNNSLEGDPVKDPFVPDSGRALPDNYLEVLSIDGIMGRVDIPSIDVDLPVYHGTSEEILKKGVGHIEGTAFPIGTDGHAILTGHTGLPDAVLFTKLDKLEKGDSFYLTILDKTFEYRVDQIDVILPDDFTSFKIEWGNYVTLVTCTPYGVNSHRLLVRGAFTKEVKKTEAEVIKEAPFWRDIRFAAVCAGAFLVLVMILILVTKRRRKKRSGKDEKQI